MPNSDRKWGAFCYLPVVNSVICLIAAVRKVESSFCLFHARQGLMLFGLWLAVGVMSWIVPFIAWFFWLLVLFLHGYAGYFAYNGVAKKVPFAGDLVEKIPKYYIFRTLTGREPDE